MLLVSLFLLSQEIPSILTGLVVIYSTKQKPQKALDNVARSGEDVRNTSDENRHACLDVLAPN